MVTYNIFTSQAGRRGDAEEVRRVIREMTSQHVPPNDMTYHGLMVAYHTRDDAEGVKGAMEEMKGR